MLLEPDEIVIFIPHGTLRRLLTMCSNRLSCIPLLGSRVISERLPELSHGLYLH
jgi:hypothetical protein